MKKILTVLLALLLCSVSLFAATEYFSGDSSSNYGSIGKGFRPNNAQLLGMGNAGVALMDSENALFYNPASLASGEFRLSVPSIDVTLYHAYDMMKKNADGTSFIDQAKAAIDDNSKMTSLAAPLIDIVGTQFAPLMKVDASVGFVLPFGLGLGIYTSDTVYTYDYSVIDEADAVVALGYGYKFDFGASQLSVGLEGKVSAVMFNKRIGTTELLAAMGSKSADGSSSGLDSMNVTLAGGWAPLFDIGATYEMGPFSVALVCSDINFGGYNMEVKSTTVGEIKNIKDVASSSKFKIKSAPNLTLGGAYKYESDIVDVKVAMDMRDIIGLFDKESGDFSFRKISKHIGLGTEVGLIDTFYFRLGMNSGYWTVGTSVDIFALRVDAAYFWQEMGSGSGQSGLDGLTIRFNLGFER